MVSIHIQSVHKIVVMSNESMIETIHDVINNIESYNTAAVRDSDGNWNIWKYIKENSKANVIFNGDGADELMRDICIFIVLLQTMIFIVKMLGY